MLCPIRCDKMCLKEFMSKRLLCSKVFGLFPDPLQSALKQNTKRQNSSWSCGISVWMCINGEFSQLFKVCPLIYNIYTSLRFKVCFIVYSAATTGRTEDWNTLTLDLYGPVQSQWFPVQQSLNIRRARQWSVVQRMKIPHITERIDDLICSQLNVSSSGEIWLYYSWRVKY